MKVNEDKELSLSPTESSKTGELKAASDCYCVCHSPWSSSAWCQHCQGNNEVVCRHRAKVNGAAQEMGTTTVGQSGSLQHETESPFPPCLHCNNVHWPPCVPPHQQKGRE